MNTFFKILASLLVVMGNVLAWGGYPTNNENPLPKNKVPGSVESKARRLMHSLKKDGFEVERGYFRLYTEKDCPKSFIEMSTCYGNNPAAPYITFSVPPWPEEYIDPATDEAFGQNLEGFSTSYRLDPREAIIILGKLPPPASYFGLQTYLFTHQGAFHTDSPAYIFMQDKPPLLRMFFQKVLQNPERLVSLASLSDSINHVVIEGKSDTAFDQQRYFIITPDEFMDQKVREALGMISIEEEDIFTERIPSNTIIGLDESSDDFVTLIRYAMPDDGGDPGDASSTWRDELPLVVLRVRDAHSDRLPDPYPAFTEPEIRQKNDEFYLAGDLTNLVQAVSQRWGQPSAALKVMPLIRTQPFPIEMVGSKCMAIGMNCLADTQDASYQYSFPLPLGNNIVYALVGTLGTQTGNATYVGLGLTSTKRMLGFDNRSDEDLINSAGIFAQAVNNTDKFFVYYFTRDCSGIETLTNDRCLEISETDLPLCADPTADSCDKLSLSLRDYMPLGTQRGPDDNFVLPARVIPLLRP